MKAGMAMIKKGKRKKSSRPTWTEAQTTQYKELVNQLEQLGYLVRREELKRGHCWRVLSGACRSLSQNFIFVDSRLSPEDQVSFLNSKWSEVDQADLGPSGLVASPA